MKQFRFRPKLCKNAAIVVAAMALLAGCASTKSPVPSSYDFGPVAGPATPTPAAASFPAMVVADVSGPATLDTDRMFYRLTYANAQQALPYAYNRWAATPLQLMSQRLKARIAQGGVKVLSTTDATGGLPLLRLEMDEFSQNFASATQSTANISLRASLFRGHQLVDQRTFTRSAAAPSADAAGGASALAATSDAIAADLLAWLATLPPR
ncbi:ABC-type transport auxiliary lipoprotein family protein [Pseudoduganella umbonata]|uniref:ABC transporter n=1 Tax=Pseudoduganella umbonata TaxID=864828 RepID=A0A4P8HR00_9BURK|nr:ABC-type transport auxiliary lipoprotein family protein [Pseudoduganella umbonata]MBB3225218.1 cholesterol transport system auxiliary component [Pseudoduganella umbonata]QCP12237.1 ABC transporter [Pseudoduganella umbonata]